MPCLCACSCVPLVSCVCACMCMCVCVCVGSDEKDVELNEALQCVYVNSRVDCAEVVHILLFLLFLYCVLGLMLGVSTLQTLFYITTHTHTHTLFYITTHIYTTHTHSCQILTRALRVFGEVGVAWPIHLVEVYGRATSDEGVVFCR